MRRLFRASERPVTTDYPDKPLGGELAQDGGHRPAGHSKLRCYLIHRRELGILRVRAVSYPFPQHAFGPR